MSVLEKVMQMQERGLNESQIIDYLKEEGISPKEIYEALNQSRIKSEISQQTPSFNEEDSEKMRPSISEIQEPYAEEYSEEKYPEEYSQQEYFQLPEDYSYSPYSTYQEPGQPTANVETISEIAEQIIEEKNAELKKQMSDIKNFKEETKTEIERLTKRIEKIEDSFNELQLAIIKKIGEYGEDIKNIATEMHETQNSFSKILNPLTDNIRELQKIAGISPQKNFSEEKNNEKKVEKKPKTKTTFEEYLR